MGINTWDVAAALTHLDWTLFKSIHEVQRHTCTRTHTHLSFVGLVRKVVFGSKKHKKALRALFSSLSICSRNWRTTHSAILPELVTQPRSLSSSSAAMRSNSGSCLRCSCAYRSTRECSCSRSSSRSLLSKTTRLMIKQKPKVSLQDVL